MKRFLLVISIAIVGICFSTAHAQFGKKIGDALKKVEGAVAPAPSNNEAAPANEATPEENAAPANEPAPANKAAAEKPAPAPANEPAPANKAAAEKPASTPAPAATASANNSTSVVSIGNGNSVGKQATGTADFYVNSETGSNRNDGSKAAPFKNLQKAIDAAADGATIWVAEGNYFGLLGKGNINITKPLKIYGGYSADFANRDILKYMTMVQPTVESNGSQDGQGTMQIQVNSAGSEVVIDGLIFDRGNSIAYNPKGEGQPEGVASAMMQSIGTKGVGGANLDIPEVATAQSSEIYFDNPSCNITISNCAFINSPNYGIRGNFRNGKALITNNIFINNLMSACEIPGTDVQKNVTIEFSYNTVLFIWSRTRSFEDMGYGYRYMTGADSYVHHNIIGLTCFSGLDRTRVDSNASKEEQRITTSEHNIFFLNRQTDLTLPGGGMFLRVKVSEFDDVEQLDKVAGNKSLTDPNVFKGKINEAYLNGFLTVSYKETANYKPDSSANEFRRAMGMNQTASIQSTTSMFANRYPWKEALVLFGAINGYGAQTLKN